MKLVEREKHKLKIYQIGTIAQKRLARNITLNVVETIALLSMQLLEFIRDGETLAQVVHKGSLMLGRNQVMKGVEGMIREVQVEGTFKDGTKLVTVHDPVRLENGDLGLALYGSFLPIPSVENWVSRVGEIPGEVMVMDGEIVMNEERESTPLKITNVSDRPIQIGSHYHLMEANLYLEMDRAVAYGQRLNVPAGTAVRFEPGDSKTVSTVPIGGDRIIYGGNHVASGSVDKSHLKKGMENVEKCKYRHRVQDTEALRAKQKTWKCVLPRFRYAQMFGPTTGDRIRLGNTQLIIEIENDFTVYGDECKFGGGKVLRDGMGQATGFRAHQVLDTVITNAVIIDYTGIYKADLGIKNGNIAGIGKAGNPNVMEKVTMIVGVNTDVIAGEGLIVTAGGMDSHVHFICPQLCTEALGSGVTSLVGGGTGPSTGTKATTCTPSPNHLKMMLQATDAFPMNIGFTGKGNSSLPQGLQDIVDAGAVGLKLHEDWGTTPAAIDTCLSIADENDIQVTIHTDTLNESSCLETTIAAFKNRSIHTYHSEGAGGGHAPDIIQVCSEKNVIPSSTNPTRPYTVNTIDEHLDMLMVCHHLDKNIPEDVAFAESRIRGETIAAEDILQDMGAISIISSDSQAMGRIGEVITRTWQSADKMKKQRGFLPQDEINQNDNFRVRRYIAKYTINPAITHGMSDKIGSIEVGKLADLCLWKPAFFGAKTEMIIKGGSIAMAQMGDPNASISTPQPVYNRPMYASMGKAVGPTSIAFVSRSSMEKKIPQSYGLSKSLIAVKNCRTVSKLDMKLNDSLPKIRVDPETYQVTINENELLTCEPAKTLPLAQLYFLF